MVGHEAIAQNADRMPLEGFGKDASEGFVVAVFLKQGKPGYGPIEGMVDETTSSNASVTRHAEKVKRTSCLPSSQKAASSFLPGRPSRRESLVSAIPHAIPASVR